MQLPQGGVMETEEYNLSDMSDEEKNELIFTLSDQLNTTHAVMATLFNAMQAFRHRLMAFDVFGKRAAIIRDTEWRMRIILGSALASLDVDVEQLEADAEFERMTADLDVDDDEDS